MTMDIKVDGVSRQIKAGTLNIEMELEERTTADFELEDDAGTLEVPQGEQVEVFDDAALIFAGITERSTEQVILPQGSKTIKVEVKDWHYLADKRHVGDSFENQTIRFIARDLIANFLVEEDVVGWTEQWGDFDGTTDRCIADYQTAQTSTVTVWGKMRAADFTPTGIKILAAHAGASGNRGLRFYLDTSGKLGVSHTTGGTTWVDDLSTVVIPGVTDDVTEIWWAIEWFPDNGSSGRTARFWTGGTGETPTWVQLGTDVTTAGTVTLFSPTTLGWSVGVINNTPTFSDAWDGRIFETRAFAGDQITTGGFSAFLNPRFDNYWENAIFEWDEGGTSATDGAGNLWTMGGNAAILRTWKIDVGPSVVLAQFNFVPVSQALDALAELAGFTWWIDPFRILHLVALDSDTAPWALTWSDVDGGPPKVIRGNALYRNRQIVRGGVDITDAQVEEFVADGETRTWNVSFPLAKVPTIKLDTVTKTVGIRGLDTGKDFYWNAGANEISWDLGVAAPTNGQIVEVTYQGWVGIVSIGEDTAEVARVLGIEGVGTGKVEEVEDNPSVRTREEAFEIVSTKLDKFAKAGTVLRYMTRRSGLTPGMNQTVTLTEHELNGAVMLITRVRVRIERGDQFRYDVEAIAGPNLGSPAKYFQFLATRGQSFIIRENLAEDEILIILQQFSESWDWTEGVVENVFSCPIPATTLFPETTLLPC